LVEVVERQIVVVVAAKSTGTDLRNTKESGWYFAYVAKFWTDPYPLLSELISLLNPRLLHEPPAMPQVRSAVHPDPLRNPPSAA
jgi:hypothetical protein